MSQNLEKGIKGALLGVALAVAPTTHAQEKPKEPVAAEKASFKVEVIKKTLFNR